MFSKESRILSDGKKKEKDNMVMNIKLSEKASKALMDQIKHRKKHTGWSNLDANMVASAMIELASHTIDTDCWTYASVCITDDGELSLHG